MGALRNVALDGGAKLYQFHSCILHVLQSDGTNVVMHNVHLVACNSLYNLPSGTTYAEVHGGVVYAAMVVNSAHGTSA